MYYWLDPTTGAALYHTGAYTDEANPFFETVEEAEAFLERQAGAGKEVDENPPPQASFDDFGGSER